MYIKGRQMPDGSWPYPPADTRPQTAYLFECFSYTRRKATKPNTNRLSPALQSGSRKPARTARKTTSGSPPARLGQSPIRNGSEGSERIARPSSARTADGATSEECRPAPIQPVKALVALKTAGLPASGPAYKRLRGRNRLGNHGPPPQRNVGSGLLPRRRARPPL